MTDPQQAIKNLTEMNYLLDEQLVVAKKTANAYARLYFSARLWIAEQLYNRSMGPLRATPWATLDTLERGPWIERASNLISNLEEGETE